MTSHDARSHAGSRQDSLVEILSRISGPLNSVLLRDEPSEVGTSPVVDAAACRDLPRLLGRTSYQVLGEIGRGGMGVVLKAHDTDLGRDIAMKVMHPGYATDPMFLQRFVEEAQLGGQLQHPGIVPVYEMGLLADERPFFTMKLVKGRTLADLLRGEPGQDRARLLSIFESICLTVGYAHSRRVIHRDLKPSNAMVGAFGEVQVVDWGLAKVLRRSASSDDGPAQEPEVSVIETVRSNSDTGSDSMAGSVMGTPQYMSPEQARGEIEALDERSDVFCLGAILAEILTGRPPYTGPQQRALDQARRADLGSVREALGDCGADAALVELCLECLAPAASDRPADGNLVAQRIQDHQASVEERKRRATVAAAEARVSAEEDRKVRRLTVGLAAIVLLTVGLGGGGWAWLESEGSTRRREITDRVEQALLEAAYARGAGQLLAARSAAREALALLGSLEGDEALVARTRNILGETEEEIAEQDRQAKLEESNRSLLATLGEIRQPDGGQFQYAMERWRLEDAYAQAFLDHGLVLEGDRDEVVASLRNRGATLKLAAALDEWASMRRLAGLVVEAKMLSDIACLLDPDEYRCRVRKAIMDPTLSELVSLASSDRLDSLPAASQGLLALALSVTEFTDLAIAIYRRALARSPDDFALHMGIARVMKSSRYSHSEKSEQAVMHYGAAMALRPESIEARHELALQLGEHLGRVEEARALMHATLKLAPEDTHLIAHFAAFLLESDLGDETEQLYRRTLELDSLDLEELAELWRGLADVLHETDRFEDSAAGYEKSRKIDPRQIKTLEGFALHLLETREIDRAAGIHQLMAKLDAKSASTKSIHGKVLLMQDHDAEAEVALREAYDLDPDPGLFPFLASSLLGQEKYLLAREVFLEYLVTKPRDAHAHTSLSFAHMRLGDGEKALEAAQVAIDLQPENAFNHWVLGCHRAELGQFEESLGPLRKAIELDSSSPGYHITLVSVLDDLERTEDAAAACRVAVKADSTGVEIRVMLGELLFELGEWEEVASVLREAVALDQEHFLATNNLGVVLRTMRDWKGAEIAFRRATLIDPDQVEPQERLAICLGNLGRWKEAAVVLRRVIVLAPKEAWGFAALGDALAQLEEFDDAIRQHERSLQLEQDNMGYIRRMVKTVTKADRLEDAIRPLTLALKLEPGVCSAHDLLGDAYSKAGRLEEAADQYEKAWLLGEEHTQHLRKLANVLADLGDVPGAADALLQMIEFLPDPAASHNNLSWMLATTSHIEHRDPQAALRHAQLAVQLDDQDGLYWNTLGVAHYRAENWDECVQALDKTRELGEGGDAYDWFFLAMAYQQLDDPEEARRFYGLAVEWVKEQENPDEDLGRFQAEAAKLLDVERND